MQPTDFTNFCPIDQCNYGTINLLPYSQGSYTYLIVSLVVLAIGNIDSHLVLKLSSSNVALRPLNDYY